ncbi:MAG: hypothetical protein IKR09_01775 [Alphaproteobacteria bacterium]|nr:hypothetical protein [Alphaproteobacteria bacterium]
MSDKLEWMNRHFVLLRHKSLDDVCKIEGYKIRPDIQSFFDGKTDAEEIVWNFADAGRWKCACELLAYIAHRRAAVWWAYQCLLSLNEELEIVPAEDRDIDSIATSFEPTVPDFAKVKPPEPDPAQVAQTEAQLAQMQADYQQMRAMADPEMLKLVEDGLEIAFKEFEKIHGIHPMKVLDLLAEKLPQDQNPIDRDSPIFKAADDIKAKLMQVRQETLDTIHAVIPPKVPEHEKKVRDNAMQAVYRWIVSPDEVNAKKALDIGNECPDTPAGLLSLCAFWAGGNLMPEGEQVIPTPAGLAANGISQVLLMCALHKGGTRKLKERYEHYFDLGVEVMTGENNWEESVAEGEVPHDADLSDTAKTIEKDKDSDKIATVEEKFFSSVYKRWKPNLDK